MSLAVINMMGTNGKRNGQVQEWYLPYLPHRPCRAVDVFRGEKLNKKNEKKPKW